MRPHGMAPADPRRFDSDRAEMGARKMLGIPSGRWLRYNRLRRPLSQRRDSLALRFYRLPGHSSPVAEWPAPRHTMVAGCIEATRQEGPWPAGVHRGAGPRPCESKPPAGWGQTRHDGSPRSASRNAKRSANFLPFHPPFGQFLPSPIPVKGGTSCAPSCFRWPSPPPRKPSS